MVDIRGPDWGPSRDQRFASCQHARVQQLITASHRPANKESKLRKLRKFEWLTGCHLAAEGQARAKVICLQMNYLLISVFPGKNGGWRLNIHNPPK